MDLCFDKKIKQATQQNMLETPALNWNAFFWISQVCFYGRREKEENLRHSIYIQIQILVSQLGFNSK